jgi:hypothetical protein
VRLINTFYSLDRNLSVRQSRGTVICIDFFMYFSKLCCIILKEAFKFKEGFSTHFNVSCFNSKEIVQGMTSPNKILKSFKSKKTVHEITSHYISKRHPTLSFSYLRVIQLIVFNILSSRRICKISQNVTVSKRCLKRHRVTFNRNPLCI